MNFGEYLGSVALVISSSITGMSISMFTSGPTSSLVMSLLIRAL